MYSTCYILKGSQFLVRFNILCFTSIPVATSAAVELGATSQAVLSHLSTPDRTLYDCLVICHSHN